MTGPVAVVKFHLYWFSSKELSILIMTCLISNLIIYSFSISKKKCFRITAINYLILWINLVVGVDLRRTKIAVLARAKWVGRSNLLTVDIRDTDPSKLLAVNNSDDSVGRSRAGDISPGDSKLGSTSTWLVGPALGGGVRSGHADDGASLSLPISLDDKVVVAAGITLTTVTGQIGDGPSLAFNFGGVRACSGNGGGCRARRLRYSNGRKVGRRA